MQDDSIKARLVHFECVAGAHQRNATPERQGTITIHEGRWAYCHGALAEADHEWVSTGGVPFGTLLIRKRASTIAR